MISTLTCIAFACVGTDLGYQPAPGGGLELIVQIDPTTFQSMLQPPHDPIQLAVRQEAQQVSPSQITVVLGNDPLPHKLPPSATLPANGALRHGSVDASAAPAILPTDAAMPLPTGNGPALGLPGEQGPQHIAPPNDAGRTGIGQNSSAMPPEVRSTNAVADGARRAGSSRNASEKPPDGEATNASGGRPDFTQLADPGNGSKPAALDGVRLLLVLTVIALAASNGYVGWLFYDARQRYLGLLSRTFAAAK